MSVPCKRGSLIRMKHHLHRRRLHNRVPNNYNNSWRPLHCTLMP
jgi:hypothetical protein